MNRRTFLAVGGGAVAGAGMPPRVFAQSESKPALLGGEPACSDVFPPWPPVSDTFAQAVAAVARSGRWYRDRLVETFEDRFAELNAVKHCVATSSGTTALFTSLGALGVGPGDEVIVPPFTFMATVTVVLLHHALPIFVDSDPATFLMDPGKLEAAITDRTAAIVPVHIGGNVADLDRITAIAARHKIPVVTDACQAHLAQWRGRSAGSWTTTGCYSFQLSKNLCAGEGGAILADDEEVADWCFAFHNCLRRRGASGPAAPYHGGRNGNFRMTEFQAAVLLGQLDQLDQRARTRSDNGERLSRMLREIPGIRPAESYPGCTRNAYHLYMFRYSAEEFSGLPRNQFVRALRAEGVPCGPGYDRLNQASFIRDALASRSYRRVYSAAELDAWPERNACPENDTLCDEAVWFYQNVLLAERATMDRIVAAIRKIRVHAGELARA